MARYKDYCYEQDKMIPISFRAQILPGTVEYILNHLIDHELDLSVFEPRYCNDNTGRPAYDPTLLLKIVLYAYSRSIVSSRRIEQGDLRQTTRYCGTGIRAPRHNEPQPLYITGSKKGRSTMEAILHGS